MSNSLPNNLLNNDFQEALEKFDNTEIIETNETPQEIKAESVDNIYDRVSNIGNHKYRRYIIRKALRSRKIPIVDSNNRTIGITNQLKIETSKERYNINIWYNKIKRSQEYGRELWRRNEEKRYYENNDYTEARANDYKEFLIELYGTERGEKEFEKYVDRLDKYLEKKIERVENKKVLKALVQKYGKERGRNKYNDYINKNNRN